MANYPISKTQKMVLEALGMTAKDYTDADKKFADIGITVRSIRQGRTSVPAITVTGFGGGWTADGDGESWSGATVNLDAVRQWIEK